MGTLILLVSPPGTEPRFQEGQGAALRRIPLGSCSHTCTLLTPVVSGGTNRPQEVGGQVQFQRPEAVLKLFFSAPFEIQVAEDHGRNCMDLGALGRGRLSLGTGDAVLVASRSHGHLLLQGGDGVADP